MTLAQRTAFFEQMATMAKGGLSLRQSLQVLLGRRPLPEVRTLADAFSHGIPVAEAFAHAGFDSLETSLIEAGELSGRLEIVYQELARHSRETLTVREEIIKQMIYPILLLHVAAVLGPIPQLMQDPTGYLFSVSTRLILLYALAGGAWLFWKSTWQSSEWQRWWLRVPFAGSAARATARYRWILALHLQFSSGIALPQASRRAWASTFFARQEALGADAENRLLAGDSLSDIVMDCPELPEEWIGYLQAGEVSGRTEDTLQNLTAVAEIEWQQAMKSLARWVPKIFYAIVVLSVAWQLLSGAIGYYDQVNKALDAAS